MRGCVYQISGGGEQEIQLTIHSALSDPGREPCEPPAISDLSYGFLSDVQYTPCAVHIVHVVHVPRDLIS